jgi:hypothetical protein
MKKIWLINIPIMMVSLGLLKGCDIQNGTKIMSKRILTIALVVMTMVDIMVDSMRKQRTLMK